MTNPIAPRRWINYHATPGLTREALQKDQRLQMVPGPCPDQSRHMSLGATIADQGFRSQALKIAPTEPVLLVERVDWLDNMPISLTRRYFPRGHRFSATI